MAAAEAAPDPPWRLVSPTGVVHTVRDKAGLRQLATEANVLHGNFKQLVGINQNSSPGLPQHKGGWQLDFKVWWIERHECQHGAAVPPIPWVGHDGKKWVHLYAEVHKDDGLDGSRLHKLAHVGTVSAGSKREPVYRGWRKVA